MNQIIIPLILLFSLAPKEPNFQIQEIDSNVEIGYGIAIGDVDGDGKPDILLADKHQFVWFRNGDWKKFVMAENLTELDNVCIAARDITGDGKVEVAVGAQWNPMETSDQEKSGAVFYLIRSEDPTQLWTPVQLHHEPTVHRMRWAKTNKNQYQLIMVPLHGRGNMGGEGAGVNIIAYEFPENPYQPWNHHIIDSSMHMTHNLDVFDFGDGDGESILIGGKEGVKVFSFEKGSWKTSSNHPWLVKGEGIGELRMGRLDEERLILSTIEPIHGNLLVSYLGEQSHLQADNLHRQVIDKKLKEGHGIVIGDFMEKGIPQIVTGWRAPNEDGDFGVKMFIPNDNSFSSFYSFWIDRNGIACEDLQMADLDGDGKPELIAAGRSTHNLRIYWNKNP